MTRTLRRGASQTDGMLRWKSNEAWPWDAGAIDIKKALGVWLLGPPGWRRLDIILPEHRWTLAADNDEVLQKWVKLLEDVAPEKPVSEIRNGWMEKKGAVGGGWKLRFFVLLSLQEAETIRCIIHMRQGQDVIQGTDAAVALRCRVSALVHQSLPG